MRGFAFFLTISATGCHPSDPESGQSASAASTVLGTPELSLSPVLELRVPDSLGGFSGEVGDCLRLSTGGYAVADWGAQSILLFDKLGRFQRRIGRSGAGPGEFRAPVLLQRLDRDTLLIWDPYLRRLTWLSPTGKSRDLAIDPGTVYGSDPVIGLMGDGRLLVKNEWSGPVSTDAGTPVTSVRFLDQAGQRRGELVEFPTTPIEPFRFYTPHVQVATDGDRIYAGNPTEWRILVLAPTGDTLAELSRPWSAHPVSANDRNAVREAFRGKAVSPDFTADNRFAPTVPAFGRIYPAPNRLVWVTSYRAPYQYSDSISVLDAGGRLLAVLSLPDRFYPTEVGADYLLGRHTTDDGDTTFQVYPITWVP